MEREQPQEVLSLACKLDAMLGRVRHEVSTVIAYGETTARLSSLIAIAGLLYWCPRCGQWMGEGSEGRGDARPSQAPPPPPRLVKAVSTPLTGQPTPAEQMPNRDGNNLTPKSGILECWGVTYNDQDAKVRHQPPSDAHGRKVEQYYGGYPEPDSYPHGHEASYVRGDAERIPLYDRLKDDTVVFESGTAVKFNDATNEYVWQPNGREPVPGEE